MPSNGVSTLVLVNDREFDLHVSAASARFSSWSTLPPRDLKQHFSIELRPNDGKEASTSTHLPLIITPPSTSRFQLSLRSDIRDPAAGALMPLLSTQCAFSYEIEFIPPSAAESDYAWDNFQDQIVVHSKLSKLVIALQATKHAFTNDISVGDCAFYPRSLPVIRAPSLKLFEHVERTNLLHLARDNGTSAPNRNEIRVSESFNGAKRSSRPLEPLSAGIPLPPIGGAISRPSSRDGDKSGRHGDSSIAQQKTAETNATPPQSISCDISSIREARAVISQLRAQHMTSSRAPAANHADAVNEEKSPTGYQVTAKRELDAFNSVVAMAKQQVANETAVAKNELCYYEQFLPKASEDKPSTPPIVPLASSSTHPNQSKSQLSSKKKGNGRLPSLASGGSIGELPTVKAEGNQELSPRKNKSPKQVSGRLPQQLTQKKRTPPQGQKSTPSHEKQLDRPKPLPTRRQPQVAEKSAAIGAISRKSAGGVSTKSMSKTAVRQQNDADDGLSDFDDADPEVDAAPQLPDDLCGVAALEEDEMEGF